MISYNKELLVRASGAVACAIGALAAGYELHEFAVLYRQAELAVTAQAYDNYRHDAYFDLGAGVITGLGSGALAMNVRKESRRNPTFPPGQHRVSE